MRFSPAPCPHSQVRCFGNVMQVIDAIPWEGSVFVFRGGEDSESWCGSSGRLWLRVDGEPSNGIPVMLAFDNMEDRPIRGAEWARYEIVADVPKNAKSILVGALLIGAVTFRLTTLFWRKSNGARPGQRRVAQCRATSGYHAALILRSPSGVRGFWQWLSALALWFFRMSEAAGCRTLDFASHSLYFLLYFFPQPLNQILPPVSMIYEFMVGKILNLTASFFFLA